MRIHRPLFLKYVLFSMLALLVFSCNKKKAALEKSVDGNHTNVLIDSVHQKKGSPDLQWNWKTFKYRNLSSTHRLFDNLAGHGFRYRAIKKGPITPTHLKNMDIFYFSVARESAKGKPLMLSKEVSAIRDFVEKGGSALFVAEHNNVYNNAEVLRPILEPWGIYLATAYASERKHGRHAINYSGYRILVRNFKKHFVTDGIKLICEAGGAPFYPKTTGGIAYLSPKGHIDYGNYITKKPMMWSNHRIDKGEHSGPDIPVAVAKKVGKGRVVVLGDHSMIGAHFLGFGDNLKFALNIFQWLARRDKEPPFRNRRPTGTIFGFEQDKERWSIGAKRKESSYYYFYLGLTRSSKIYPVGMAGFDHDVDILGFLDPQTEYSEDGFRAIDATLKKGGKIFLLFNAEHPNEGTVHILKKYLPSLTISGKNGGKSAKDLKAGVNPGITRVTGKYLRLGSTQIRFGQATVAALSHSKDNYRHISGGEYVPKDYGKGTPYLLDVQISGGEPLVWAELPDGRKTILLHRVAVGNGEFILMVQGDVWSTNTMPCDVVKPTIASKPAYGFEMKFVKWLESNPKRTEAKL